MSEKWRVWREGDLVYICRDVVRNGKLQPQHLIERFGHANWRNHEEGAVVEPFVTAEVRVPVKDTD